MIKCTKPPSGWYCTRDDLHEGPCAAWPYENNECNNRTAGHYHSYGLCNGKLNDNRTYNHTRGDSELTPCGICITSNNIANRLTELERKVDNILDKLEQLKDIL